MKRVRVDDVENSVQPAAGMRKLTDPLGLTDVAINHYVLEPGDSFALAYQSRDPGGGVLRPGGYGDVRDGGWNGGGRSR